MPYSSAPQVPNMVSGLCPRRHGELAVSPAAETQRHGGVPDDTVSTPRIGIGHRGRFVVGGAHRQVKPASRGGDTCDESARVCADRRPWAQAAQRDEFAAKADRADRGPGQARRADIDPCQHQPKPGQRRGAEAGGVQPDPAIGTLGSPVVADGAPLLVHLDLAPPTSSRPTNQAIGDAGGTAPKTRLTATGCRPDQDPPPCATKRQTPAPRRVANAYGGSTAPWAKSGRVR